MKQLPAWTAALAAVPLAAARDGAATILLLLDEASGSGKGRA